MPETDESHHAPAPEPLNESARRENTLAACSPATVADRIRCPALLIHGDADMTVPVTQSRAMIAANPAIRLEEVPGATHDFTPAQYGAGRERVMKFLRECLKPLDR